MLGDVLLESSRERVARPPLQRPPCAPRTLSPIRRIASTGGPRNTMPAVGACFGELRVLGEEPVAGVHRVATLVALRPR